MEWVASTVWEHGLSSITTADAHTSAASSRLNWHPRRYKWTSPFRWKTKSGFYVCAITFHFHSTYGSSWRSVSVGRCRLSEWSKSRYVGVCAGIVVSYCVHNTLIFVYVRMIIYIYQPYIDVPYVGRRCWLLVVCVLQLLVRCGTFCGY